MSTKAEKLRALLREKALQEAQKKQVDEPETPLNPLEAGERPASLRGLSVKDMILLDTDHQLTEEEQQWFNKKFYKLSLRAAPVGPDAWMA
jgi:hypothetical protein